jgi:hypothetical protein
VGRNLWAERRKKKINGVHRSLRAPGPGNHSPYIRTNFCTLGFIFYDEKRGIKFLRNVGKISEILHRIASQKTVIIIITDEGTSNHLIDFYLSFLCLFIAQVLPKVKQYFCIPKYLVRFQEGMSARLTDISCDFSQFLYGNIGVVPWNRPRPPHSKPYLLIICGSSCLIQHYKIYVAETCSSALMDYTVWPVPSQN